MNEFISQLLMFMASYVGIIFIFYFSLNWLTKGFLSSYLKVKMSKGKRVLTIIRSMTDVYYRPGGFNEKTYEYKTRNKKAKILTDVDHESVYQTMGVFALEVDEANDNVFNTKKVAVIGTSATTADHLVKRAIMSPEVEDPFKKIVIFSLVGIGAVLLVLCFMTYNMTEILNGLTQVGVI